MNERGFKNCSSVKEFRAGMRFREFHGGPWWTVEFVNRGYAVCSPDPNDTWPTVRDINASFPDANLRQYTLDLDSIWEGRKYDDVTVLWANSEYVAYWMMRQGVVYFHSRAWFLENYQPTALDSECMAAEPPWMPKAGEPCLRVFGGAPEDVQKVTPMVYDEVLGLWVCSVFGVYSVFGERGYVGIPAGQLRPLPPPGPPVRVGECVQVNTDNDITRGVVIHTRKDPQKTRFTVCDGYGQHDFDWTKVSIAKLVPQIKTD